MFLDPGGDAVQVLGYFNALVGNTVTFDTAQKVVGVGSWKFDSGAGSDAARVSVIGVLEANRRGSFYFRYDSVPDLQSSFTEFAASTIEPYSGGGLVQSEGNLGSDDGAYATATPARNAGQGTVYGSFGFDSIPLGAIIDFVKIIYERSYDVDTSIGISRVKYRIRGVEGPDHDNTDMPLTDTVVEVDVTGDRFWERQDLINADDDGPVFQVIAEARRGDTDTAHTQSWDYLKVEVVYHTAVPIWQPRDVSNTLICELSVIPKGAGVGLQFTEITSGSDPSYYNGITELAPDIWHRIGYAFTNPVGVTDQMDIRIFIGSIPELEILDAPTNGVSPANITYGWCSSPGANKVCWFDQIYIDDGDDLADPGNNLMTAKLPATVNNDNFDTTGGTGAVNERPVDLANFRQQAATAQVDQDYTIQAASVGDVDISGETLIGHMFWMIAKKSGLGGTFGFIADGVVTGLSLTTSPAFYRRGIASTSYPSNAAGIGLRSATASNDAFLYECGVIMIYEGPPNPDLLLPWQLANEETLPTVIDNDLSGVTSYEICWNVQEFDGSALMDVYVIESEGGSPQHVGTMGSSGGSGRMRIPVGIEVQVVVTVTGVTMLSIHRRLNVD